MKKTVLSLVSLLIIFISCDKVDKFTQFHFDVNSSFTVPGSPIAAPIDILTPPISTETKTVFENNNTNADLIEEIRLSEMQMIVSSPANGDFSFLNDIEIYLSAEGQDETLIAEAHDIPDSVGDTLVMETVSVDLKNYLIQEKIQLRLKTVTDKITTQEYTIDAQMKFFVDAKILGV